MKIKVIKVFFEELNFLKKKRATDDEMAVWHLQFTGQELGPTPGGGEGQGSPLRAHISELLCGAQLPSFLGQS